MGRRFVRSTDNQERLLNFNVSHLQTQARKYLLCVVNPTKFNMPSSSFVRRQAWWVLLIKFQTSVKDASIGREVVLRPGPENSFKLSSPRTSCTLLLDFTRFFIHCHDYFLICIIVTASVGFNCHLELLFSWVRSWLTSSFFFFFYQFSRHPDQADQAVVQMVLQDQVGQVVREDMVQVVQEGPVAQEVTTSTEVNSTDSSHMEDSKSMY